MRFLAPRARRLLVAGGAAMTLVAAGGGGYVLAGTTTTTSSATLTACVGDVTGLMYLVQAQTSCHRYEHKVAWNVTGPAGAQGAIGATGPQGPKGDTGAAGPSGATGPSGEPGADGAPGAQGPKGDTGAAGPSGATGPTGPAGPPGADGAPGPSGAPGADGATGAQGPKGDQGDQGPKGDKGDKGDAGPQGPQGPAGAAAPDPSYQGDFAVVDAANPGTVLGWVSSLDGCQVNTVVRTNRVVTSSGESVTQTVTSDQGVKPCTFRFGTDLLHWFAGQVVDAVSSRLQPVAELDLLQYVGGAPTSTRIRLTDAWASDLTTPTVTPGGSGLLFSGTLQATSLAVADDASGPATGGSPVGLSADDVTVTATGVPSVPGPRATVATGISGFTYGTEVTVTKTSTLQYVPHPSGVLSVQATFGTPSSAAGTVAAARTFESDPNNRPLDAILTYGTSPARFQLRGSMVGTGMDPAARTADALVHWSAAMDQQVGRA